MAGLEGGDLAEQLAPRANAKVSKVEMLKLAGEEYTVESARLEDVIEEAAGGKVQQIGLLTPRQVIPVGIVEYLEALHGRESVVDCQEIYQKIKYEKSDNEMRLIRDANVIADALLWVMLAVLKPGMLETQVAAWGCFVARELGAEEMGLGHHGGRQHGESHADRQGAESGHSGRRLRPPRRRSQTGSAELLPAAILRGGR